LPSDTNFTNVHEYGGNFLNNRYISRHWRVSREDDFVPGNWGEFTWARGISYFKCLMINNKNIFLIVHRGALGDFIMTWPSLLALKEKFPASHFLCIGRPEYAKFAVKKGMIDSFISEDSASITEFFEGSALPPQIPENIAGAVLWLQEPEKVENLLKGKNTANVLSIRPFKNIETIVAEHYFSLVKDFFGLPSGKTITDFLPKRSGTRTEYIAVHPGSGGQGKNMSPAFFKKLAQELEKQLNMKVIFIMGPVEIENGLSAKFADFDINHSAEQKEIEISSACGRPANSLLAPAPRQPGVILCRTLDELEGALSNAALYIGNDSGASHFASFLGTPTIAIYKTNVSDPALWGTFGRRSVNILAEHENSAMEKVIGSAISMKLG